MKESNNTYNPTLKFAPFGRWDAPSARPLYLISSSEMS